MDALVHGLIQMLGVCVDTIVICRATAFVILLSGDDAIGTGMEGAALPQRTAAAASDAEAASGVAVHRS